MNFKMMRVILKVIKIFSSLGDVYQANLGTAQKWQSCFLRWEAVSVA